MTEITSNANVLKLPDLRSTESGLQSFRCKDTSFFKTEKEHVIYSIITYYL